MINFATLLIYLRKQLHYIYLLYAIPMVYMAATVTPAYQTPDEPNHFARAEQVSRLDVFPTFVYDKAHPMTKKDSISNDPTIIYPDRGGFAVDRGINDVYLGFKTVQQNYTGRVNAANVDSVKNIKWGTGIAYHNFANTAIYPPVVYIMPALGITIGKLFNITILNTLYVSRVLNGALCILMCFFALKLAKRSNILLFIVLLFPMTVTLFASVSQDPFLISCAFLLAGIIDNVEYQDGKSYAKWQLYAIIILLSIIGVAKPPYILFVFITLFLKLSPKIKVISIVAPVMVLASWLIFNHPAFTIKFAPAELHFNAKLQVQHIVHHPFKFLGLFFRWDGHAFTNFFHMFVGVLGWLDTVFNNFYYFVAYTIFFAGLFISSAAKGYDNLKLRIALVVCFMITLVAVLTAQYVTWTALESSWLEGIQGRYVTPIYPLLALALSSKLISDKMLRLQNILFCLILTFPIFTALNMIDKYIKRFYLR